MIIEEPNQSYRRIFPIIGMALLFVAGFLVAYFWMNAESQKVSKDCAAKLAESQKEESVLQKGNALPPMPKIEAPAEFFSVGGNVEKIDGKKITIKSFSFGEEKNYQVTVGDETKITKREIDSSPPKSGEKTIPTPKETEVNLVDIKVGDSLTVDSADNIKGKSEFTAKSIYIETTNGLLTPPSMPDASSIPIPSAILKGESSAPPAPAAASSSETPSTSAAPSVPSAPKVPTSLP